MFGLHTAEFKRWVSRKEANSIKAFFNLNPNEKLTGTTYFYQNGVTRLWIEEVKGKKPRYYLHVIINFSRALKLSNYKAMPYTIANVKKVFTAITKTLNELPISNDNAIFSDWTPVRIDSVFDIYEEHTELLMILLNQSINLSDRKKRCSRIPIPGKTAEESISQSMRFGNNSFTYNIYRKIEEIFDKGKSITEKEKTEVQNLLRVERQSHQDAVKKLLPDMKAYDLANSKVQDDILKIMIDEAALFFGKGDFYAWKRIEKTYLPEHKADILKILDVMKQATNNSLETVQDDYKNVADTFSRLRISPVGIRKQDQIEFIQGIYNRITAEYPRPPDKRQYNSFPVPHQTGDGRISANITLYDVNKGKRIISVAGRSLEDYENKVLYKLKVTYLINRPHMNLNDVDRRNMALKSADSIKRFFKVSKTAAARNEAKEFIESVILVDEKKFFESNHNF